MGNLVGNLVTKKKRKKLKALGLQENLGGFQYIPDKFKPLFTAGVYKFKDIVSFWEHISSQSSDEEFKGWISKYLTFLKEVSTEFERSLTSAHNRL